MMLNKLEYTLKIATSKLEELEKVDDKTQPNLTFQFKKHSKELTPIPREEDGAKLDHTILNSKSHSNLATIGRIKVSKRRDTTKDAMSNNWNYELLEGSRSKKALKAL